MKKTLVCPLNWGLGHAARCVPVIRRLIAAGAEVVVAADGYPLQLLQKEFPELRTVEFQSCYPITYAKGSSQVGAMLRFLPKLKKGIALENNRLAELLENEHFETVISDNRFGMWSKNTHTVYITHQIMVKMPKLLRFLEPIGYRLHKKIIEKYDECWIPDYAENGGLSGDLSHKYPLPENARFIGILSRFSQLKEIQPDTEYENVIILSGVEPQRTIFEGQMLEKYRRLPQKTLMVQGKPAAEVRIEKIGQVDVISHLDDEKFAATLKGCKSIVFRAGYSTVMDLETLQVLKKAQFHPTPGQTEQEYLAVYLSSKY